MSNVKGSHVLPTRRRRIPGRIWIYIKEDKTTKMVTTWVNI